MSYFREPTQQKASPAKKPSMFYAKPWLGALSQGTSETEEALSQIRVEGSSPQAMQLWRNRTSCSGWGGVRGGEHWLYVRTVQLSWNCIVIWPLTTKMTETVTTLTKSPHDSWNFQRALKRLTKFHLFSWHVGSCLSALVLSTKGKFYKSKHSLSYPIDHRDLNKVRTHNWNKQGYK